MKTRFIATLAVIASVAAPAVHAATVLLVDLRVENQITLTATSGTSSITASGSDTTGFYLDSIFGAPFDASIDDALVSGDLTSAENTADGSPLLFTSTAGDGGDGLNVFSYTGDPTGDFVADSLAFSGSATWDIDGDAYAALLGGAMGGDVYFPADDENDLAGAFVVGQWERAAVIPVPAAFWLLGSALFGLRLLGPRRPRT